MRITLLQRNIHWCDPQRNRLEIEQQLRALPATDLCVLPEMFTTGFCMEPSKMAEPSGDGVTLKWMQQLAAELNCALAGSVAVKEEACYFNRLYFVTPGGETFHYDKRHLFTYGGERECYHRGHERCVVEYQGYRFLLQVCYDLRFPVFSRNQGDYDVALYVANWPTSRREVWNTLLKARALENQCYVIGVNRVGEDPQCPYNGGSMAFDAYGRLVVACTDGAEETITFEPDWEKLDAFRKKFPVLEDEDTFYVLGRSGIL